MVGVSALGRWMFAMAMRRPVALTRGARRATSINNDATTRSRRNTPAAVAT